MSLDRTRQYAMTVDGIRPDHVARYRFAAMRLPGSTVLDAACGCGYGSKILHDAGHKVTGIDIEPEAIVWAKSYFPGPEFKVCKVEDLEGSWDAAVSFETLEHVQSPLAFLSKLRVERMICSVPNEELYPWSKDRFKDDKYPHLRHYTPTEFDELLSGAGFRVDERWCQRDKQGSIYKGTGGIFLIYVAHR